MSKSSASSALDTLAAVFLGQGTSQPHVPPPAAFVGHHHAAPPPAAAPSWYRPGGRPVMDHGQIARSLVHSDADGYGQDRPAADWLAIEGAWAAFAGAAASSSSHAYSHTPSPRPRPPELAPPTNPTVFDPWAAASSAHHYHTDPFADAQLEEFESVWSQSQPQSTRTAYHDDASRIRPVGSHIDDVADSVWESVTSAPAHPWSWKAEVNTARSTPISAHEAQVRAQRGRARLGMLARQMAVVGGKAVGEGSLGEGIKQAGRHELEHGQWAGAEQVMTSPPRGGARGGGGQERVQQPAAM